MKAKDFLDKNFNAYGERVYEKKVSTYTKIKKNIKLTANQAIKKADKKNHVERLYKYPKGAPKVEWNNKREYTKGRS